MSDSGHLAPLDMGTRRGWLPWIAIPGFGKPLQLVEENIAFYIGNLLVKNYLWTLSITNLTGMGTTASNDSIISLMVVSLPPR